MMRKIILFNILVFIGLTSFGQSVSLEISASTVSYPPQKNVDGSLDTAGKWDGYIRFFAKQGTIMNDGKVHTLLIKVENAEVDSTYTLRLNIFKKSGEYGTVVFRSNEWENSTIAIDERYFHEPGYYDIEVAQNGNLPKESVIWRKMYSWRKFFLQS